MSMIEIAIQRTSNMMIDVFEESLRESLTEYLSPELAKQIFEDVFNRAKDKSYERKLASEKRLEEVSNAETDGECELRVMERIDDHEQRA